MSYKQQIIEWDVLLSDVQIGEPVGYEVEFSLKSFYYPVLYRISTYEEVTSSIQGTFFYSLDGGQTWIDFPRGESGQIFNAAYKMRVVINVANSGFVFVEKGGTVYRIDADLKENIENLVVADFTSTGFDIDAENNDLYISGQNNTLYKIDTTQKLKAGDNSLNIRENPLGFAIDGSRNLLWQVQRDRVLLKNLDGELLRTYILPEEIDVDYSSSSSSSGI